MMGGLRVPSTAWAALSMRRVLVRDEEEADESMASGASWQGCCEPVGAGDERG